MTIFKFFKDLQRIWVESLRRSAPSGIIMFGVSATVSISVINIVLRPCIVFISPKPMETSINEKLTSKLSVICDNSIASIKRGRFNTE